MQCRGRVQAQRVQGGVTRVVVVIVERRRLLAERVRGQRQAGQTQRRQPVHHFDTLWTIGFTCTEQEESSSQNDGTQSHPVQLTDTKRR